MAEIYKTKRLKVASAIFIAVLIIGFITFQTPVQKYSLSIEQTIAGLSIQETTVSPSEVLDIIHSGKKDHVFIDVRNVHEYLTDHLDDAINIPLPELINEENLTTFKNLDSENLALIIYGKDIQQANGAFMLLKQLGIKKVKLITAGFNSFKGIKNEKLTEAPEIESLDFDEALVRQPSISSAKKESKQRDPGKLITPVKRAKKTATPGGC